MRANLIGTLATITDDYFESCSKPGPWKKLVFSLAFFHAMIQERRKFGPLVRFHIIRNARIENVGKSQSCMVSKLPIIWKQGWNVKYEFNNSDLECSMSTLKMFLDEQEEVPWESLVYVTGQVCFPINHARKGSRQIVGQSQSCMVVVAAGGGEGAGHRGYGAGVQNGA